MNAGFWIRLGAGLLDGLIVGLPLGLLSIVITNAFGKDHLTDLLSFLYALLVPVVWKGYTIGKKICGVRIAKLDGSPPTILTMLLRNVVGGLVYAATLGIAVVVSAFMVGLREDKRAIHDFIAGTEVVRD
ncbi:RDD family protein [Paenibacillus sp. NEAU-GSW1]|uniref:RDD family protein n=1 Tax=Paenibacillus sp. NEAU-GSW1 TaxID=2682486 RepID=UPI0012E214C4|nr:RDD family protein [Paenibacillus sp. NEAU-GSW1]MUT65136.1 RDD family protein [Paenibacillus sp. NEAU-GSW1]